MSVDIARLRKDFPILDRTVRGGRPLIYLDSANTSQKPRQVIDTVTDFYERHNANIHRANHELGEEATAAYEDGRIKVARFIGSSDETEVVFTKNISEAINLVAYSLGNAAAGRLRIGEGDEVVITEMEHHSNIVPWQLLCQRTGARLRWFGVTPGGRLDMTNVGDLGADFVGFTGHKMCGPTGIGVLWARRELLEEMPPFLGGGEMIESVWMDRSTYAPPPHKFEAGTMPIAEAVGLGAAVDYLTNLDLATVRAHEQNLVRRALQLLGEIDGLRILGPTELADRGSAVSFRLEGIHPHDVSQVLDDRGVAVRAGHHCAWPLHRAFGVQASTRASFYLYNTADEVEALADGIRMAQKFFRVT